MDSGTTRDGTRSPGAEAHATVSAAASASARVFLIGAGAIARYHAAAVGHLSGGDETALAMADPDRRALAEFGGEYPEARPFNDARAMLAEPALPGDVVVVATPPFTHRELTLAALASGRHVLCEKPLAMDRTEALEMLRAARAAERLLGCCSTRFLGLAATEEAKRIVEGGELGALYHATFVNRRQRGRSGVEYQPATRWFLDRGLSGGGTLMDWSPYDFTTLNHVLDPVRVDVLAAWMTAPETAVALAPGTVLDTEQHVGASLRYHRRNGQVIDVTFERAACTHGPERVAVEIEGTRGAVAWDWLDWLGTGDVTVSRDRGGKLVAETTTLGVGNSLHPHHRPLVYFHRWVRGEASLAVVDERAVFNFSCIRAIYDCVRTGEPQSVTLEDGA